MELEDTVGGYAAEVMGDCPSEESPAVVRFPAGNRHAVYKVSYRNLADEGRAVVVRLSLLDDAAERAQAGVEAAVLRELAGTAAPLLYDFRAESRWFPAPVMCMEFIDGDQRALASASLDDVERLGQATASVHNLPVDNVADFFPGPNRLAAYAQERLELNAGYLPRLRDPLPADVRSRLDRAFSQVAAAAEWAARAGMFTAEEPLALLHGDAADGNIFWSKQPVLIDWEYARLGDPADEVAYIFGQHALNGAQRSAFWRGYRRTSHARHLDQVVERAKWWEPVLLLGSSLWWLERWSRRVDADAAGEIDPAAPKPPEYYLEHASRRLDRLLATGPNAE